MSKILTPLIHFQMTLNAEFGFSEDITVIVGKDTYRMFQKEALRMCNGPKDGEIKDMKIGGPDGSFIHIKESEE